MSNSTEIAKGFKKMNEGPLDEWYGPYESIALANTAVPVILRWGKTVGIITSTGIVEHWWPNINSELIIKTPGNKSITPEKTDFFAVGKNKLNKNLIIEGQAVNGVGEIINAATYSIIKIPCKAAQAYAYSGIMQGSNFARIRFENAEGALISFFDPTPLVLSFTFTTPLDCVYMVANTKCNGTSDYDTLQIEEGAVTTYYEAYGNRIPSTSLDLTPVLTPAQGDVRYPVLVQGKNLINKAIYSTGFVVRNTDGAVIPNVNGAIFRILVNPETQYTFSGAISYTDQRFRFEDINNVKISYLNSTANPFSFTTPANCKYVVMVAYFTSTVLLQLSYLNTAQLELGPTSTNYDPYKKVVPALNIDPNILIGYLNTTQGDERYPQLFLGKNLADSRSIVVGQATDTSGNLVTLSNWANFTPIPVTPNTTYTFSGIIPAIDVRIRFENASHVKIGFLPSASSTPITFTTPESCYFVVVPAYNSVTESVRQLHLNSAQLELGGIATAYERGGKKISPFQIPIMSVEAIKIWQGKKIIFFGDSITAQDRYTKLVAAALGCTYAKDAVAGSCIATGKEDIETDGIHRVSLWERADGIDLLSPDIIFIFASTNDWYYQVPLGAMTDTTTNTFYGGLKGTLAKLQSQNSGKRIAMSNMLQRTDLRSNYASQKLYADATLEVCRAYGVPCYDAFGKSGITYENTLQYTSDKVHPKAPQGDELIARQFAAFLNSL